MIETDHPTPMDVTMAAGTVTMATGTATMAAGTVTTATGTLVNSEIGGVRKRQLSFDADANNPNVSNQDQGVGYKKRLGLATNLCASISIQDSKTQEYFAGLLINMNETLSVKNPRGYASVLEVQNVWRNFSGGFEPSKIADRFITVQTPTKQRQNHVSTQRFKSLHEQRTSQAQKLLKTGNGGAIANVKAPTKCSFCQMTDHRNTANSCPKKSNYGRIVPPVDITNFSKYLCTEAPRGQRTSNNELTKVNFNLTTGKKRHIQIRTVHPIRTIPYGTMAKIEQLAFHVQMIGGEANDVTFNGKISGVDLSKFFALVKESRHIFEDIERHSTGPGFASPPDQQAAIGNNAMYPNYNGILFGRYPHNQHTYGHHQAMYPINYGQGHNAMMMGGGTSINQTVPGVQPGTFSGNRYAQGMDGMWDRSNYAQGNDAMLANDEFFKNSTSL